MHHAINSLCRVSSSEQDVDRYCSNKAVQLYAPDHDSIKQRAESQCPDNSRQPLPGLICKACSVQVAKDTNMLTTRARVTTRSTWKVKDSSSSASCERHTQRGFCGKGQNKLQGRPHTEPELGGGDLTPLGSLRDQAFVTWPARFMLSCELKLHSNQVYVEGRGEKQELA